jgi:ATP-dependent Clp protease ATP-binding subunit ClpA
VDFRNVIVVMTSNLGANVITELPAHMKGTEPQVQESIMDIVRHTLSPELLNRIDETIVFNRLQREDLDRIVEIGFQDIANRLETGQNMTLDVSPTAVDCIAERGYDVRYGARPLKRTLVKEVLNPLSRMVLEGGVIDGDVVRVRTRGEAEIEVKSLGSELGWLCSNMQSSDKNDVVIMRNHKTQPRKEGDEGTWDDDDEWLLEGDASDESNDAK